VVLMSAMVPTGKPAEVPFLRKPFALDQLIDVIAVVLAKNGRPPKAGSAQDQLRHASYSS